MALGYARHLFIVGRAHLRQILAMYTGVPAQGIRFEYGRAGKPLLSGCRAPSFNLSHCGELAAMVVSRCGNVGIDIERVRPASAEIVTRFFTAAETAALANLSGTDWLLAFYRCWTRKEALVKANGNGLFSGLAKHDVLPTHSALVQPLQLGKPQSPDSLSIYEFEPAPGFIGAIALGSHRPAVLRRFSSI